MRRFGRTLVLILVLIGLYSCGSNVGDKVLIADNEITKEDEVLESVVGLEENEANEVAANDYDIEELDKEQNYWSSQPLDISKDGTTCYVLDYYGGQLDEKYLKFKKLDFSKNHGKHIKSVRGMVSILDDDKNGERGYYGGFFGNGESYVTGEKREIHFSEDLGIISDGNNNFTKGMFLNLEEVNLTGLDLSECEDMSEMFAYCPNLKKVDFANLETKNVKSMYKMFHRCENLETIENFNIDTQSVEEMQGMFFFCKKLKNVDFSSFTADKLLYMDFMFYKCESLENINLNKFSPDKCFLFNNVFMLNKKLKSIDLSSFKTDNGKNFSYMFYGCENLESLDLSAFNIENAEELDSMFYGCKSMMDLNLASFRLNTIGRDLNMNSMFEKMENIKKIDLSSLNLDLNSENEHNYIQLVGMFKDCYSIEEIDLANINLLNDNIVSSGIFDGCAEIKQVNISNNIDIEKNLDKEIIKQINFVRDYEANHKYCERRNRIYNRELIDASFDGWQKLVDNEFAVIPFAENQRTDHYKEFFEIYEKNKYDLFPSFVTTDSMLHTYHLYFDFLMKKIEKDTLSKKIVNLSNAMYLVSTNYYNLLKGSEWENEAKILKAYFAVPLKIFDENFKIADDIKELVEMEISKIEAHSESDIYKPIFADWAMEYETQNLETFYFRDDYTQFKPRGHYDGDEDLEKYFKVFMWYGRTDFRLSDDHLTKLAMLMSCALNESGFTDEYNSIKKVIYYFAGESDDRGPVEYADIMEKIYGSKTLNLSTIVDKDNYSRFKEEALKSKSSIINSGPGVVSVEQLTGDELIGFRFIGQTYTYDEEMFKRLIYDYVKQYYDENGNIVRRYLPDFLDVPASLNSKTAENILKEKGDFIFPEYETNLRMLQKEMTKKIESDNSEILYAKWIRVLKKLIDSEDNEIFPSFMKNNEWKKKKLETFGGSYAELKHDTILYTKQTFAAEGGEGGYDEFYDEEIVKYDDKGYVEPETEVYMELYKLATGTLNSFTAMGMLDKEGMEFLGNFAELSMKLYNISKKELEGTKLSDEDYDLIRGYGGIIEHLITDSGVYTFEYPDEKKSNAIVADIATGSGNALEIATGNPIKVYVIVEVDGKYKVCSGGVYDFYQFTISAQDRMTDKEWRAMMGFEYAGEIGVDDVQLDSLESLKEKLEFQNWTDSYRQMGIYNTDGEHIVYKFGVY